MEMKLLGIDINYEINGHGKEILVLHGWGGSTLSISPIVEHLSCNFKVVALDLPGFGRSQAPNRIWGVSDYAELVKAFMDRLNMENPILLGHSFGGRIIIYLTGKMKVEAKKIILVNSAGIKPKRGIAYYLKVKGFKCFKIIVNGLFGEVYAQEIINSAVNMLGSSDYKNTSGILRGIMVKIINEDLTQYLSDISAPTLLIWGENDIITPVADGKLMEKKIPDAGLVVLKNAGHYSYLDKIYEFNLIVDHFLRKEVIF